MPRKIIVQHEDGPSPILTETLADDEAQLQELVKENPDLIPIEDLGMGAPLMVVGRETSLPSGAVDLVGVSRSGEVLVIEFKTGPQNTDFRHALSQMLDYGSDLWTMSFEEFESAVATRYFVSDRCRIPEIRGKSSIQEAALATWPDMTVDELAIFQGKIEQNLTSGTFDYILVAQRFSSSILRTIEYLNSVLEGPRLYAVELVRFMGNGLSAFESRVALKPSVQSVSKPTISTNEIEFLNTIHEDAYREGLREMFEACRGLRLHFEWGSVGTSIRVLIPGRAEPVTIAWLFPPNKQGWMGLRDLNLGFDPTSADRAPMARKFFDQYLDRIALLTGVEQVNSRWLRAYTLTPEVTLDLKEQVIEVFATLVGQVNGET